MNRSTLLLAALSAALFTAGAGAEKTVVYKTVNADGTVSYSQDPVEGAEKRVVGSGTSTAADEAAPPPTPIPDEMRPGTDEAAAAEREACATATANLAVYASGDSVTLARGEGEAVTLTGDELAAARADAQRQVDRFCKEDAAD